MVKRSRQKFTILGRKRGFKMKQQALCMIFKGLLLKQIKQYFSEVIVQLYIQCIIVQLKIVELSFIKQEATAGSHSCKKCQVQKKTKFYRNLTKVS